MINKITQRFKKNIIKHYTIVSVNRKYTGVCYKIFSFQFITNKVRIKMNHENVSKYI